MRNTQGGKNTAKEQTPARNPNDNVLFYELNNGTTQGWCPMGENIRKHRMKYIMKILQCSGRKFTSLKSQLKLSTQIKPPRGIQSLHTTSTHKETPTAEFVLDSRPYLAQEN